MTKAPLPPPTRPRRLRRWIVAATTASGLVTAAIGGWVWYLYTSADVDTIGALDFANRLRIPPQDEGRLVDGRRVFDLDVAPATHDFGTGQPTPVWGINGTHLGPTLRARPGEAVTVNVANGLAEPTTVHWHGMHLPAAADGGPHQPIAPGATRSPQWVVDQPPATLWYHPHPHQRTSEQLYRGLAGMFILDTPGHQPSGLPDDYGVDDLPVVIQDKSFNDDGTLDFGTPIISPTGFLGDTITINGTTAPHVQVTTDKVRLRVLNASNARIYNLGLEADRPFWLVGTDGGFLPRPVELTRVQISPGDRVELVVEVHPGDRLTLRSYRPDLGAGPWNDRFTGGHDRLDLLQLRAADTLSPTPPLPRQLDTASVAKPAEVVTERSITLTSPTTIDNRSMDMARIDHTVTAGTSEIWTVTNSHGIPHNIHIHDVQFHVLDIDGTPPPPALTGRHDTVYIPPGSHVRLLIRFGDYADPRTPYMFHCHITQHEDRGMMSQFSVIGSESVTVPPARNGSP